METREVRFDVPVAWRSTTDSSITWWSCPPGTRVADRCFSAGGRASMEEAQKPVGQMGGGRVVGLCDNPSILLMGRSDEAPC